MTGDDLIDAVQRLIDLTDRGRAQEAVDQLRGRVSTADLLRAADGAQQVARALATSRSEEAHEPRFDRGHDPHDVRSLYS